MLICIFTALKNETGEKIFLCLFRRKRKFNSFDRLGEKQIKISEMIFKFDLTPTDDAIKRFTDVMNGTARLKKCKQMFE